MTSLLDALLKTDWRTRAEVVRSFKRIQYSVIQIREDCNLHWDTSNRGDRVYTTEFSEVLYVI